MSMHSEKPCRVLPGVVEVLQVRTLANDTIDRIQAFELGQMARIADGPFADFTGMLEQLDAVNRIRILPDLPGRPVSVASRGEVLLSTA